MSENINERYLYTQNRELSWLRFDQRVLEEAADQTVPTLERLKFVSIFSSNLDEFFMVRVGSLFDITQMSDDEIDNKTGWTATEQLRRIYAAIPNLITLKREIYGSVMAGLAQYGVKDMAMGELDIRDRKRIETFFKQEMLPLLSPILIGPHHPIPHLANKELYAACLLDGKRGEKAIGIVPMPTSLPPYVMLEDGLRYIRTENILEYCMPALFSDYKIRESCILTVTRNADISFDDEKFDDNEECFRKQVKKLLKQRDFLAVVRLELSKPVTDFFRNKLEKLVKVEPEQVYVDTCPLNMGYAFGLAGDLPADLSRQLVYKPYVGRWSENIRKEESVLKQVQRQDRLLMYPYDSVDPFLRMLNEAAEDPDVQSIKITIYRLASSSKIAHTLCRAAENGKDVLALMELRARFDEENNLAWSQMLEDSGCQVIYGMEGFKCHSKVCLITLRSHGKTHYVTQIGTGNYNEKTNTMYTDLSLITSSQVIGEDAAAFFRNMLTNNLNGQYRQLCVSPHGIKNMLLRRIDEQIKLGKDGYICIKANAVTEREVIDKLCEASKAGVEIQLIIRGICCILPGIPGYTENIHVSSIVGRYLEHARIYLFGKGDSTAMYIASADLMTRNLNRRVEIACPVFDSKKQAELKRMLEVQLRDTDKASRMMPDGTYTRKFSGEHFDAQAYLMEHSLHLPANEEDPEPTYGLSRKVSEFFQRTFGRKGR